MLGRKVKKESIQVNQTVSILHSTKGDKLLKETKTTFHYS